VTFTEPVLADEQAPAVAATVTARLARIPPPRVVPGRRAAILDGGRTAHLSRLRTLQEARPLAVGIER
jgi:hypothetical protein